MIVDFFSQIPASEQKWWKKLNTIHPAADGSGSGSVSGALEYEFPQMETQLKLLYTAITRCCNRLVFVETRESVAGTAFFRWLKDSQLAEQLVIEASEDVQEVFMSNDEWRVRGIELAMSADGSNARTLLRNAVKCFDRAGPQAKSLRDLCQAQEQVEELKHRAMIGDHMAGGARSSSVAMFEKVCTFIVIGRFAIFE